MVSRNSDRMQSFRQLADKKLEELFSIVQECDTKSSFDVDLQDGMLHIVTSVGAFVVNRHSAAGEIWLSSPISGPYHFSYRQQKWLNKDEKELDTLLYDELKSLL